MEHIALLLVKSRIKPTSPYTLDHLNSWYNEELINDVLNLPVPYRSRTILRYKNMAPSVDFPYVAIYPLVDMRLLHGPIADRLISKLRDQQTKAFDGDKAFEHIDFKQSSYRHLDTLENEGRTEEASEHLPLTMITELFPPPDIPSKMSGEALFRTTHRLPPPIQECDHHLRSSRYKLMIGKPQYLVVHYFNCEPSSLKQDILMAGDDKCIEREVYSLIRASGSIQYPPTNVELQKGLEPNLGAYDPDGIATKGSFSAFSSTI